MPELRCAPSKDYTITSEENARRRAKVHSPSWPGRTRFASASFPLTKTGFVIAKLFALHIFVTLNPLAPVLHLFVQ